jgi:hypothetical protein
LARECQQQKSEERRDDALGREMRSQDGLLDRRSECAEPSGRRQRFGNAAVNGLASVEAAARTELGIESDKEWAEARANLLSYMRLLREWRERSVQSAASQAADLPNAA